MLTQYRGGDSYIDEHYEFTSAYGWGVMVFNATFDNISAILWRSVLLLEETGVLGENHRSAASH